MGVQRKVYKSIWCWQGLARHLKEALYPSKCGLCGQLGPASICSICKDAFISLERIIFHGYGSDYLDYWSSLYAYQGRAAQAIRRLKYSRATSLSLPLAKLMYQGALELDLLEVDLIIPVPIHWKRRFERGFNQAELLCSFMPFSLVQPQYLKRIRATIPQVQLSPSHRLTNLAGCFKAFLDQKGASVLLVDDVMTSGGTANEAAKALKEAGAGRVGVLTFCGKGYRGS